MSNVYIRKTLEKQLTPNTQEASKKNAVNESKIEEPSDLFKIGYRHYTNGCYLSALYYFQQPELENNAEAQFWQGFIYRHGKEGVPVDHLLALKCFLNSAPVFTSSSCNQIGLAFEKGLGVGIDLKKALEWYYKGNQCSFNTVKLMEQGISLNDKEKEKSIKSLIQETLFILHTKKTKPCHLQIQENDQLKDEYTYNEFAVTFN